MDKVETQPTLGFQRVMQRAIVHAQSVEKREVRPVDVLVALMSEKDCPAVYFLQLQSVSRVEILRYLAHGDAGDDGAERPSEKSVSAPCGSKRKSPCAKCGSSARI